MLQPVAAKLSSNHPTVDFEAANCIDGNTEGPDFVVEINDYPELPDIRGQICQTKNEPAPWIAVDYGTTVTVQRVEIFNRRDCCGERTQNVDVRISDEIPTSGSQIFSGGTFLGHFAGPATNGQHIIISGQNLLLKERKEKILTNIPGQALSGRYVVVQMNNGENTPLNLKEVKARSGFFALIFSVLRHLFRQGRG